MPEVCQICLTEAGHSKDCASRPDSPTCLGCGKPVGMCIFDDAMCGVFPPLDIHPEARMSSALPFMPEALEITRLLSEMTDPRCVAEPGEDSIETLRSLILRAKRAYGEPESFDHVCPNDDEEPEWCDRCGAELRESGACDNDHEDSEETKGAPFCGTCGESV